MTFRLDFGELQHTEKTPQGYLKTRARVGRTGVLTYYLPDGTVRRELRLEEEMFAPESVATLTGIAVVNGHPAENGGELTAANTKKFQVGFTGEQTFKEDDVFLGVNITLTDERTVQEAESGEKQEISCGYSCDHEETPGVWNGEEYDLIQRRIRYNHVAVVTKGRAGDEVRLMLDSQDSATSFQEKDTPMPKHKIAGVDVDCTDSLAAALNAKFKKDEDDKQELLARLEALVEKLSPSTSPTATTTAPAATQASTPAPASEVKTSSVEQDDDDEDVTEDDDGLSDMTEDDEEDGDDDENDDADDDEDEEESFGKKEKKMDSKKGGMKNDSQTSAEKIKELAAKRATLIEKARRMTDCSRLKLDSLDNVEIMRAVVKARLPKANLDSCSEPYVKGYFDCLAATARNEKLDSFRSSVGAAVKSRRDESVKLDSGDGEDVSPSEAARRKFMESKSKRK